MSTGVKFARWVCLECHYIHDPEKGDPKGGFVPGPPLRIFPTYGTVLNAKSSKKKKGYSNGWWMNNRSDDIGIKGYTTGFIHTCIHVVR